MESHGGDACGTGFSESRRLDLFKKTLSLKQGPSMGFLQKKSGLSASLKARSMVREVVTLVAAGCGERCGPGCLWLLEVQHLAKSSANADALNLIACGRRARALVVSAFALAGAELTARREEGLST